MDLQHITAKLYCPGQTQLDLPALIPVFHRWIQRKTPPGLMMIDVADYSHVERGPGVMLICHEGYFAVGEADGGLGVMYANKRLATGWVRDRLRSCVYRVLAAASLLEQETQLPGPMTFETGRWMLRIDDRLVVPNSPESFDAMRGELQAAMDEIFDATVTLEHIDEPRTGLAVQVNAATSDDVATLLGRVG